MLAESTSPKLQILAYNVCSVRNMCAVVLCHDCKHCCGARERSISFWRQGWQVPSKDFAYRYPKWRHYWLLCISRRGILERLLFSLYRIILFSFYAERALLVELLFILFCSRWPLTLVRSWTTLCWMWSIKWLTSQAQVGCARCSQADSGWKSLSVWQATLRLTREQ